jgi:hypothetical protein
MSSQEAELSGQQASSFSPSLAEHRSNRNVTVDPLREYSGDSGCHQ